MLIEQTKIAEKLGISRTQFRKLMYKYNMKFELIDNKRHYEYKDVLELIQKGNINNKNIYYNGLLQGKV